MVIDNIIIRDYSCPDLVSQFDQPGGLEPGVGPHLEIPRPLPQHSTALSTLTCLLQSVLEDLQSVSATLRQSVCRHSEICLHSSPAVFSVLSRVGSKSCFISLILLSFSRSAPAKFLILQTLSRQEIIVYEGLGGNIYFHHKTKLRKAGKK